MLRLRRGRWIDMAVALALAGVAAVLRVEHLGPPSLWVDDAWVALVTKTGSLDEFLLVSQTAPGFSALEKGWLALVGFSETNAQLLPLVFGIAVPAPAYLAFVLRASVGSAQVRGHSCSSSRRFSSRTPPG